MSALLTSKEGYDRILSHIPSINILKEDNHDGKENI